MPEINWDDLLDVAKTKTDKKFQNKMSSLTSLTDNDIDELLKQGIKKEDIAEVLKVIDDATVSNNSKAKAIQNITKGVEVLVSIAKKVL